MFCRLWCICYTPSGLKLLEQSVYGPLHYWVLTQVVAIEFCLDVCVGVSFTSEGYEFHMLISGPPVEGRNAFAKIITDLHIGADFRATLLQQVLAALKAIERKSCCRPIYSDHLCLARVLYDAFYINIHLKHVFYNQISQNSISYQLLIFDCIVISIALRFLLRLL